MIFLSFPFLLEAGDLQARGGANWENIQVTAPCVTQISKYFLKDKLPHFLNACQHSMPDLLQQIMNDRADQFPSGKNHTLLRYFLVARNRNPFELV